MSIVWNKYLPLLSTAPGGMEKVRGLILDLAVRGKLVPQNLNEEPASELLTRLTQERASLEADGACKKMTATLSVDEDAQPFGLPATWCWCRLPDVADYRMGKTPPTKEPRYWSDDGTPWVSISDMVHGETVFTTSRTVSSAAREKVFKNPPAPAGTLLMSFKLTVGKIAVLGVDAFHNEAIISIFPFSGVSKEFLCYFLPMIAKGGNSKNALMGDTLNSESLSLLVVPLPPFAEQQRIVAKVEELMAICDQIEAEQADGRSTHVKLVDTLLGTLIQSTDAADFAINWERLADHFDTVFTTESSVDSLKQIVLQLAVMGKLVPQDPSDEPARKLLERICANRLSANVSVRSKPNTSPEIVVPRRNELPSTWEWARLLDLAETGPSNGYSPKPSPHETPFRCLTLSATTKGYFKPDSFKYVEITEEIAERYFLKQGDLLIQRGNSIEYVGIAALYDHPDNLFIYPDLMMRLQLTKYCNPRFIHTWLISKSARNYFMESATGTQGTMPKVNQGVVSNTPIPIPPLAEQHRIVAKVDELMYLCDMLKADLIASRNHQAQLASTLIKSAL